ncbi:DivIVA domain-containing protein [Crossiella equi]|uniref:DivIVA domain-containing protein n=1 Tax=Crossiella equi TaxID=130796 RepID=A0ABS5AIQ6_9PSEU|nr:DivIVA domain-containing protein [Crossiella equi]MBP2476459.1 DivIVA domain-containing protein [Crossiella equi]
MTTALIYLVVMIFVAAVVFLVASLVFGRGEQLAPLAPGATPTELPSGPVSGADVRAVRFQQVVRGYKMSEVDWVLARTADELDALRARVAELESEKQEANTGE